MPSQGRPQRKAAAVAREKIAAKCTKTSEKQTDKQANQQGPSAGAAPQKQHTNPRQAPMKREEAAGQTDKHTQEKKEEEGSTAPLPEKVSLFVMVQAYRTVAIAL